MKKILLLIGIFILCYTTGFSQFPRDQRIIAGEYFINSDPGEGNGTNIPGNYNYWEVTVNVNSINAPVGSRIYVRFKSTNGKWSAPRCIQRKEYFVNSGATLPYGEVYTNNDPGQGNASPINIQSGTALITGLKIKRGDIVYVRLKDSFNRWSPTKPVKYNFKDITKAVYKIKHSNGGFSTPDTINTYSINSGIDTSAIFLATKNNIPWQTNDSVFVSFQTADKFWCQYKRGPLQPPPIGISLITLNIPRTYKLHQNYPNPFNPFATIKYDLSRSGFVNLSIFDLLGRNIETLVNQYQKSGYYKVTWNADNMSSGVYFYKIQSESFSDVKRMILIK